MTIQQAIYQALVRGKSITRNNSEWKKFSKIMLGNMHDDWKFIVYSLVSNKKYKGWQPDLEDILANDWGICD